MTPVVWAWIMSSSGALLFFAAGSLFTLRRAAAHAPRERERDREHSELARLRVEREQLSGRLLEAEQAEQTLVETSQECARLRAACAALEKSARDAALRADDARRRLTQLEQRRQQAEPVPAARPSLPDSGARGDVLRTILDDETRGNAFTGAVITDELGLVVAATGEYGDALAAYGAFLAGVGAKTRDALPLRELRQLVIQDDCNTTLTVRPIASTEDHLALVTLAPGQQGTTRAEA